MGRQIQEQLSLAFNELLRDVVNVIPALIIAIVLIVLALIVATVVERLLRLALQRLRFDALLRRVGVDHWLHRVGVRQPINEIVPRIVYFLLLFLFARTAADTLGLTAISGAIGAFMAYLPNLLAALLILLFGSVAAQFVGRAVANAAAGSGIEFARSLGNFVSGVLLFILGVMALGQLRIDTEIIRLFTVALLASLALAFGLSFGLGSRQATRNIIAGFYARRTFRVGDEIEVAGEHGVLSAITPTQTLLRRDGRVIAVANSSFLDDVARQ